MEIVLNRFVSAADFTIGTWSVNGHFVCYTLEDEHRETKVHGETRIPEGTYRIELQAAGKKHAQYLKKYGAPWHQGMLHVVDVPGFEGIMVHTGNTDDDTEGCILVGNRYDQVQGRVFNSIITYGAVYPAVRDALLKGEHVSIKVMTTPNVK